MPGYVQRLILLLLLFVTRSYAQSYTINNSFTDGATVSTCSGIFTSSNPYGNYDVNENYTVTFCSGSPNKAIQAYFPSIDIGEGDTLFVYDGNSTAAPAVDTFTNVILGTVYITSSSSNTSGCLTFKFVSDVNIEATGWRASINCVYPCNQSITATTGSIPAKDLNGYTNICFGNQVTLQVNANYPDNNKSYRQADTSSLFRWSFGDGTDTAAKNLTSVTHVYKKTGGYYATVTIIDSNGCSNKTPVRIPVRTSLPPVYNITPPPSICLFDTALIKPLADSQNSGSVLAQTGSFVNLPVSGDSVFLPDQPPRCFTSSIVIDQFAAGQTLNNINDLKGIYLNLEHSYEGDLTIAIESPDGSKVYLKKTVQSTAGDGTFLGEPVDESLYGGPVEPSLLNIRGKGYEYSFNNSPQHGTMFDESSKYTFSYTDNGGQSVADHYYLPGGSYQSEDSLYKLLGTPLNGKWTLEICDKQNIDNGYLFNWRIEFSPRVMTNAETYTVPLVSQAWVPSPGLITTNNTTAIISPSSSGTYSYDFKVKDAFGCINDSLVSLVVNPIPSKPNLGADTTICTGQTLVLKVSNVQPAYAYSWSTGQAGADTIHTAQPGSYSVKATDALGCTNSDTIAVAMVNSFKVSLGADSLYCESNPAILKPTANAKAVSWLWNTGATTQTDTLNKEGIYWVQATNEIGCIASDTINVDYNPINSFELPNDTAICNGNGYLLKINPPAGTNVMWDDGSTSFSRTISHAGTYKLTAVYKGCLHNSDISVSTQSLPVINIGRDTSLCISYSLPLTASHPGASIAWSTGDIGNDIIVKSQGTYWAEATINGCSYRDSIIVKQKACACQVNLPNAFSPNGDGINDQYRPEFNCIPKNYQFSIFNRDGRLIYNTKNQQDYWDGRYNGGPLPLGTYYYILTFYNISTLQNERLSGSITILR